MATFPSPDLLLHAKTANQLQHVLQKGSQVVLLVAENSSGKQYTAMHMAAQMLDVPREKLAASALFVHMGAEELISVEEVRKFVRELSLKNVSRSAGIQKVFLLEHLEGMNDESQNTLLKSLEEMPAGVVTILTTDSLDKVRPTIRSRSTIVYIVPPSLEEYQEFLSINNMSIANLGQLYALSGGKAGALLSFIRNPNQYEELVAPTKEFLSQTSYQRLLKQQDYASSRSDLLKLVDNISVVAEGALHSASSKNDPVRIEQWSNILRIIEALQAERDVAVNSKLLHTYLSLAI